LPPVKTTSAVFLPPPTVPLPPPPLAPKAFTVMEEMPSKRLRKPSSRFMSEEDGYVDIFSKKRTPKSVSTTKIIKNDFKYFNLFNSHSCKHNRRIPRMEQGDAALLKLDCKAPLLLPFLLPLVHTHLRKTIAVERSNPDLKPRSTISSSTPRRIQ